MVSQEQVSTIKDIFSNIEIANVIAIIAIIVSITGLIIQLVHDNNKTIKDNNRRICNLLLGELFLERLPRERKKIHYNGTLIEGIDGICDIMCDIVHKSEYYKYIDKKLYDKIRNNAQDIEDYVLKTSDKVMNDQKILVFQNELNKKFDELYETIIKQL